jgi:lactam utilization protein B
MKIAVEWFADRISHGGLVSKKQFNELLEQAKEMFEKQIIEARQSGIDATINGKSISNVDYFNETFKQQEQ